jgi:hypothetical protein
MQCPLISGDDKVLGSHNIKTLESAVELALKKGASILRFSYDEAKSEKDLIEHVRTGHLLDHAAQMTTPAKQLNDLSISGRASRTRHPVFGTQQRASEVYGHAFFVLNLSPTWRNALR